MQLDRRALRHDGAPAPGPAPQPQPQPLSPAVAWRSTPFGVGVGVEGLEDRPSQLDRSKIAAMRGAAAADGTISGLPAVDLLVLVQAVSDAWLVRPVDLLTADGARPMSTERLAAHRQALDRAVLRLIAVPTG